MELRNSASAAQSFMRKLFGNGPKRYAIEVDGTYADAFDIPGTEMRESWENADGSVTFILESRADLRSTAQSIQGVRRVSMM